MAAKSSSRPIPFLALWLALWSACAATGAAEPKEDPPEVRFAAMRAAEYGPLGTTAEQILKHESTQEPITLVGALVYRIEARPPEKRSLVERKLVAIYWVQSEVNNGGFDQYFSNSYGDDAALALQALRDIGSAQGAKLLQRAIGAFPAARPPADRVKRQALIERMRPRAAATWTSCDNGFYLLDDLGKLALAYAKKNRGQILAP